MKARASTTTMKILRKVSITLFAVDSAPRDTSTGLVHLKPSAALFHAAWKVGCWQLPLTNDLGRTFAYRVAKARSRERKPILETSGEGTPGARFAFYTGPWDFLMFPGRRNPVPAILIGGGVPVWAMRATAGIQRSLREWVGILMSGSRSAPCGFVP